MAKSKHFKMRMVVAGILVFLFCLDLLFINNLNKEKANAYLNESIVLAGSTYATCRIINGVVSVFKDSTMQLSFQPMGLGTSFEIAGGQVLDPIDDATERISSLAVNALALLGVQKMLLLTINKYTAWPFYVVSVLGVFFILMNFKKGVTSPVLKFCVLLWLIRISLPVSCLIGIHINESYFEPESEKVVSRLQKVIEIATADVDIDFNASLPPENGLESNVEKSGYRQMMDFLNDSFQQAKFFMQASVARMNKMMEALNYMKDDSADILNALKDYFVLLLQKIIIQVFIIPLATLWFIRFSLRTLTGDSRFDSFLDQLYPVSIQEQVQPVAC